MLTKQLADILQNLQSPGNFYTSGTQEIFPPSLEVNQVGRISLPLLPVQAEQLIKVADRAPYGKGYETLVDTEVRRTWQMPIRCCSRLHRCRGFRLAFMERRQYLYRRCLKKN